MTERELERRAQRRLAVLRHVEEVSGNVAATCRYYGISRQCYYGWLRRFEADGLDGLKDRSQRPHHSPRATQADIVEKIIWLRQHYHFGPAKIAMYLGRYHDVTISVSGVWRILKRLGLNRLPASQRYRRHNLRWKRYEKQRPGHQLQVDVKFIEPLGQTGRKRKYYQFTAIDDCTRLRVLRAYPRCDQKTAIAFIDHTLSKLPLAVERVQTDNGPEFGTSFHGTCRQRHRSCQDQTPDAAAQRQSGAIPPHRLRRVLPTPRRPSHRRHPLVHRQTAGMGGGLLQLPSPSLRSRRPNTLRAPAPESPRPTVIGVRQLHICGPVRFRLMVDGVVSVDP
jgi:transposase